jgi:hypothetical protein
MMILHIFIPSLILLIIPTFLWAQEPSNSVSGTIGDRSVTGEIWAEQSDFYGDGSAGGVSIMTRPVARDEGLGSISIGFEGSDFPGGDFIHFEISIRDSAAESMSEYYADLDQDLHIAITRSEKNDGNKTASRNASGVS